MLTQNKVLLLKYHIVISTLALSVMLVSCAHYPPDRYNTQAGAVTGAGMGALIGQAIGGNTQSTLIGLAAGTILGSLVGNAIDQDYQAARDAARYGKPVIYYDKNGRAIEAIPEGSNDANCRKVRKRVWQNGTLTKETVEEVCSSPAPTSVVRYYPAPPPPPYYYGWWGWPFVPRFSFYFDGSYYHGHYRPYRYRHYYRYRPYAYHRGFYRR